MSLLLLLGSHERTDTGRVAQAGIESGARPARIAASVNGASAAASAGVASVRSHPAGVARAGARAGSAVGLPA